MALADHVPNISAKHEGGDPAVDGARAHPSDILDYFRAESEVIESGDWENLAAQLHGQARRDEPHGASPHRARPELRGGAEPPPLSRQAASQPARADAKRRALSAFDDRTHQPDDDDLVRAVGRGVRLVVRRAADVLQIVRLAEVKVAH